MKTVSFRRFPRFLPEIAVLFSVSCASAGRGADVQEQADGGAPSRAAVSSQSSQARPSQPLPGATEIGDPYYPGLGNGGYDVEHYDLVLDVDMAADELIARVTVRARALQDLASFSFDLRGLEIEEVLVDGREAEFERSGPPEGQEDPLPTELVIHPDGPIPTGTLFETQVSYYGVPEPRPDGAVPFMSGVGWERMETGVYVLSECAGASSWFPCNDHPRDKATYSFRITVEVPFTAAANGRLIEVLEEGDRRTFVFEAKDPMASYLATVNVAEFDFFDIEGPRGIPGRIYHPTDATEQELAPFRRQPEILGFLESVFGPYPFESAGGVLAWESGIPGALECQTLPVYGRGSGGIGVIVHELAHQWYGDSVSPDLWRDMWLNEGFASYAGWLWTEHEGGREAYEANARRAYGRLRSSRTGSPFDPGLESVFSGRVYTRGAMVLYGLRAEVEDGVFFDILQSWAKIHHDGNASTQNFVEHASRVAKRDLGPFFEAWLFSDVTPEIPEFGSDEAEPRRRGGRRASRGEGEGEGPKSDVEHGDGHEHGEHDDDGTGE